MFLNHKCKSFCDFNFLTIDIGNFQVNIKYVFHINDSILVLYVNKYDAESFEKTLI